MSRTNTNEDISESDELTDLQSYLDEMKGQIPEGVYLELCNKSKKIHSQKEQERKELEKAKKLSTKKLYEVVYHVPDESKGFFGEGHSIGYNKQKPIKIYLSKQELRQVKNRAGHATMVFEKLTGISHHKQVKFQVTSKAYVKMALPVLIESITKVEIYESSIDRTMFEELF